MDRPINCNDLCLAMLVRDEAAIIERCLTSLKPFISCYYIIDTGSTDDTPALIRTTLGELPGNVVKIPFSSFALLREQLYQEASKRADYVLFVDADETLQRLSGHPLTARLPDIGLVEIDFESHCYRQARLFASGLEVSCSGYVYEQPVYHPSLLPENLSCFNLKNKQDAYRHRQSGQRSIDMTYLLAELATAKRDAEILLQLGKLATPLDSVKIFLRDCIDSTKDERILWQAYYCLGRAIKHYANDNEIAIEAFMHAYDLFPDRAEPLQRIIDCLQDSGKTAAAESLTEVAQNIELPLHADYFEPDLYR